MKKKTLSFGVILTIFIGICIIPNVNCTISKENTQLYPPLDYNGSWSWKYPDSIYCKITKTFSPIDPEHQNYKTAYDNKDFSITPTDSKFVKKSSNPLSSNGNTLYVGGSGPGNYTRIKAAINDAFDGDTVFVFDDSSPYYEGFIEIKKSINLIGENRETTIIDGDIPFNPSIIWVSANGVTISGFTIQNGGDPGFNPFNDGGIQIRSDNNIISGNIILDCCYGLVISGSSVSANYNTISDNIIVSNGNCGAYIQKSNNNVISMNTFSDNYYFGGLALDNSRYNNVSDNIFINDGVYFYDSYKNSFLNNMVNDKPLMYLEEESDRVLEEDAGQVILIKCDNVTVQNQDLSNTSIGLFLCDTDNCLILNSTFSSSECSGIILCRSDNNNISMNIISNEYVGILVFYSHGNTIFSNTVSSSNGIGIGIQYSNSNNILINTFLDNWCGLALEYDSEYNKISGNIFIDDGALVYNALRNTFLNNYVNNKPLIYLKGESDIVIDEDAGQVLLVSCNNITVQYQELSNTCVGIILVNTHNCLISDNIFDSNKVHGIFLTHSSSNNISKNTVSDNSRGITFDTSHDNIIQQNIINLNRGKGIWFSSSNNNIVSNNAIENNQRDGIFIEYSNYNIISSNSIKKNGWTGVFLLTSSNNEVSYNNFINNARAAYFNAAKNTKWHKNYWNRPRILPKLIIGESSGLWPFDIRVNFDWRPALQPYMTYL